MNKIISLSALLIVLATAGLADEAKKAERVVTLQYMAATTAYEALKQSFPEMAEIVRRIQIEKNALIITPAHPKTGALRKKLAEMDKPPAQVLLSFVLSETVVNPQDGSTKDKILSRPTLFTLEGKTTEIAFGQIANLIQLTVTASSSPAVGGDSPKTILLRSSMSLKTADNQTAKKREWVDYLFDKNPIEIMQYAENGKLRKITVSARCVSAKLGG